MRKSQPPSLPTGNSYLCTYDLYGPVRAVFDVLQIHYEGKWEGVGPWNREFFGPVKWHQADRRVPIGAQKTRRKKTKMFVFNY